MNKRFRVCTHDQPLLLPPSLQDWLPESRLARFVADVMNELDLSSIYEVSGGDIQNAVLKAALAAAAEPIPNGSKKIHQRHFEAGIGEVLTGKRVMQQSIFADPRVVMPEQDVIDPATASPASQLLTYGLSGAALLVALIALGVALLK